MNIFDDLEDPLGPPPGDALGAVLARARRHRVVRRGTVAVIALVALVVAGISANALAPGTGKVHVAGNGTTVPALRPTSTTSPSTPTSTTTTDTRPPAGIGPWSGESLTITPVSLGRVDVGMKLGRAQIAAGLTFDGAGDGAYYPTTLPAGFPHLFVRAGADNVVTCVGAQVASQATPQTVTTPEGFRLGDTVQRLQAIYGNRARYAPAPASGISPRAGYVVAESNGNLVFALDSAKTRIFGIAGGGRALTPSSCTG